jgi:hypothetical protein
MTTQMNKDHLAVNGADALTGQSPCSASGPSAFTVDAPAVNLAQFCGKPEYELRFLLHNPWEHKGYRYASNGHICVRVPAPEAKDAVCEHKIAESARVLFEKCNHTEYAPLPAFDLGEVCRTCEGKGKFKQVTCADCDGDGYFDHGCHEYDCKNCDAFGSYASSDGEMRDCPTCNGYGHKNWSVPIGNAAYAAMYLALIKTLPSVMFAAGEPADGTKPNGQMPAHFIFTGGEGVLMPRKKDDA